MSVWPITEEMTVKSYLEVRVCQAGSRGDEKTSREIQKARDILSCEELKTRIQWFHAWGYYSTQEVQLAPGWNNLRVSIIDNTSSFCLFFFFFSSSSSASFGLNSQDGHCHGHKMLSQLQASYAGMTVSSWRRGISFHVLLFQSLLFRLAHSTPKLLAKGTIKKQVKD